MEFLSGVETEKTGNLAESLGKEALIYIVKEIAELETWIAGERAIVTRNRIG